MIVLVSNSLALSFLFLFFPFLKRATFNQNLKRLKEGPLFFIATRYYFSRALNLFLIERVG